VPHDTAQPRANGTRDTSRPARTHAAPRRIDRRAFLAQAAAGLLAAGPLTARVAAGAQKPRWWSSLVWGAFENRAFAEVASLPSHRRLAREGAVLTRYFAVAHPSGPNYRAMASGETWGHAEVVDAFHPTVASEGAAANPPIPAYVYHLAGTAARKHDPLTDLHAPLAGVRHGLETLRNDLREGLPASCLVYVGWDDQDDMHSGSPARADRNLTALLDVLAASPWFTTPDRAGRFPAFFFCYDEDDGSEENRVFAAWWGRGVRRGYTAAAHHTHYGFCRTMTENWGLPALGRAALEDPIDEVWT
jgi:hypothetical protein